MHHHGGGSESMEESDPRLSTPTPETVTTIRIELPIEIPELSRAVFAAQHDNGGQVELSAIRGMTGKYAILEFRRVR